MVSAQRTFWCALPTADRVINRTEFPLGQTTRQRLYSTSNFTHADGVSDNALVVLRGG